MNDLILPNVDDKAIGDNSRERKVTSPYYAKLWNFEIFVKPGFIWDGASIPRLFWSLIGSPFTGRHARPSFIHDCLYAGEFFTRKHNDWCFLELLDYTECSWVKRNLMWGSVKSWGWRPYQKHTQQSIEEARKYITIKPRS